MSAPRPSRPATSPRSSSSAACRVRTSYDNTTIAVSKVDRARTGADHGVLAPGEPLPVRRTASAGSAGATRRATSRTCRLLAAQLPGPGPVVRVVRRAERVPGRRAATPICSVAVRGKPGTKAELLAIDRAAMLPLPDETLRAPPGRAAPRQLAEPGALRPQRLLGADRLRPPRGHRDRRDRGGPHLCGTELVATHARGWDKEQVSFDPRHYLALLERKPGALDFARPLEGWELPGASRCCAGAWRPTSARRAPGSSSRCCASWSSDARRAHRGGRGRRSRSGRRARTPSPDPLPPRRAPVGLFSLDGHPHLKAVERRPARPHRLRALPPSADARSRHRSATDERHPHRRRSCRQQKGTSR